MIEHLQRDKSTVISIVPFTVRQFFPGVYPGTFEIPACLDDAKPELKVVGASEHIMHVADRKEGIRIATPSAEIANAIVQDFIGAQLWTAPDAVPGILWLSGEYTRDKFLKEHKDLHQDMLTKQRAWFVKVCKETDNDWQKYHHTRVVSDLARFSARALGLEPEWLKTETVGLTWAKCPACSQANDPNNAVCTNCRCVLNEDKFKVLKFAS